MFIHLTISSVSIFYCFILIVVILLSYIFVNFRKIFENFVDLLHALLSHSVRVNINVSKDITNEDRLNSNIELWVMYLVTILFLPVWFKQKNHWEKKNIFPLFMWLYCLLNTNTSDLNNDVKICTRTEFFVY